MCVCMYIEQECMCTDVLSCGLGERSSVIGGRGYGLKFGIDEAQVRDVKVLLVSVEAHFSLLTETAAV